MADIDIENVVVSTNIAKSLNLEKLSEKLPNSKYMPEDFSGLVLHFDKSKTAVFLFSDGKAVCTGAKSVDEADTVVDKARDKLSNAGVKLNKKPDIQVENMVASIHLNKSLDLKSLAQSMWLENVDYTPEKFPGLIYKIRDLNAVILVFDSGKVVCTGSKLEDISAAIDKLTKQISSVGM